MHSREFFNWLSCSLAVLLSLAGCASKPKQAAIRPGEAFGRYQNLYVQSFRNLPKPNGNAIRQAGTCRVYPCSVEQLWFSCLDVIGQYDAVAFLSADEGLAVFSHGIILPDRYQDTVLAVLVEAQGADRAAIYVAWLPPKTLVPARIPAVTIKPDVSDLKKADPGNLESWGTAMVADDFLTQITIQALYQERWKQKFNLQR